MITLAKVGTSMAPIRVVCIEDESEMIDLVSMILSREGYQVIGAPSGLQGLQIVEDTQPELVLLDLMMPDLDGWEVYQRLKSNPKTTSVPIIVLTARAQSIDKILGLHIAKVDDYITKPFSPTELLASIAKVLSKKT